jgi:hypothetical protein
MAFIETKTTAMLKLRLFSFIAVFAIFLISTGLHAQVKKEILGTFETGCKVFNYNFTRNSNGLYSFRIEYAETETLISAGDKESLASVKKNLPVAIKAKNDSVSSAAKDEDSDEKKAKDKQLMDSLKIIQTVLGSYISDAENNANTINNIYAKREELIQVLNSTRHLAIFSKWPEGATGISIDSFTVLVKNAITAAVSIAETKTYPMSQFEEEPFRAIAIKILKDRKATFDPACFKSIDTIIERRATALFYDIKARLDFLEDEPATANLKLKTNLVRCYLENNRLIRYHVDSDKNNRRIVNKFFVDNVSVEFEDGTIKNIFADMSLADQTGNPIKGTSLRFKNISPISISTKTDPDAFEKIKMFSSQKWHLNKKFDLIKDDLQSTDPKILHLETKSPELDKKGGDTSELLDKEFLYFYLSDLLDYSIIAENDREDYSPANTVVELNKQNASAVLKKEKRSKILTARAYTDFIGIQDDQPNGLIQVEASKRINFNTAKYGGAFLYVSIFSYVEPVLSFSKIEKNKNALELNSSSLDSAQTQAGKKQFMVSPVDIYKYQKSSFDIHLNLMKINIPELKLNIQFNTSLGMLKTNTVDTLLITGPNTVIKSSDPNFTTLNTLRWGFSTIFEIKPENRYGICLGWDRRNPDLLTQGFTIPKVTGKNNKLINTAWVDAFLKTNEDSKLFFRYRFTFEDKKSKNNFSQIQLGYLMDLFKTKQ